MSESKTYLELSADKQWLRVFVDGKQVVSFHVHYAIKTTDEAKLTEEYKLLVNNLNRGK